MPAEWLVLSVNPEPWAVGDLHVGRRNGKMVPGMSPNRNLVAYKEAIKEAIGTQCVSLEGPICVTFYFWRRVYSYSVAGRGRSRNRADATNMQKATEDALQGVLFENDRDVMDVRSVIVEQGPDVIPCVVIKIEECAERLTRLSEVLGELPAEVMLKVAMNAVDESEGPGAQGVAQPW